MRAFHNWLVAILAGILLIIVLSAAIGDRDREGQSVSSGVWAQDVCGVVATWRGAMEAIAEDLRGAPSIGDLGVAEPQSQTPQSRSALVRESLGRAIEVTDFAVHGLDRSGTPDSPQGAQVARSINDWARAAEDDLEQAQDTLEEEADTLEESLERNANPTRYLASVIASGRQTLIDAMKTDPQLAAAAAASSTCQKLQEDTGR
jgi:hypothetical protein